MVKTTSTAFDIQLAHRTTSIDHIVALSTGGFVMGSTGALLGETLADVSLQRLKADGSARGNAIAVTDTDTLLENDLHLVALTKGRFAAIWEVTVNRDSIGVTPIFAEVFNRDGSSRSGEILISSDSDKNGGADPTLVAVAGGIRAYHAYEKPDSILFNHAVRAVKFSTNGEVQDTEVIEEHDLPSFLPPMQSVDAAQMKSGSTAVIGHALGSQGFDSGSLLLWIDPPSGDAASPVRVDMLGQHVRTNNSVLDPKIAGLASGDVVTIWVQGGSFLGEGIALRRFDMNGNPVGDRAILSDPDLGFVAKPYLVALPSGGYVVSWTVYGEHEALGRPISVVAQEYSATGDVVGKLVTISKGYNVGPVGQGLDLGADGRLLALFAEVGSFDTVGGRFLQPGDTGVFAGWIKGTAKSDILRGTENDDMIKGLKGADTLRGGLGADDLRGGKGQDKLIGGRGNDVLDGGAGNDLILGRKGNDVLVAGSGRDVLVGGAGADTFVFRAPADFVEAQNASNLGKVRDFTPGKDSLTLTGFGLTGVPVNTEKVDGGLWILDDSADDRLVFLVGVDQLGASDVMFI